MRQELECFRQGTAEFIAPEYPPGRLVEMNCFDPNRCCCLHYPGLEKAPTGWQLSALGGTEHEICRQDPSFRLRAIRPQKDDEDGYSQWQERCGGHRAWIVAARRPRCWSSEMFIHINPCFGSNRCLLVSYNRTIHFIFDEIHPRRMRASWLQAIDPDSYGLTDDEESYGVLWCRQPGCRNYYRYAKKPLVPEHDIHR